MREYQRCYVINHPDFFLDNPMFDAKTPISVIYATISLIESLTLSPAKLTEYLEKIKEQCMDAIEEINDIETKISKYLRAVRLDYVNANIPQLLMDITESARPLCLRKNLKLEYTTNTNEKVMAIHFPSLEQIMLSLISHFIDISPKNQTINVHFNDENQFISISVIGKGLGLDLEFFPRIYSQKEPELTDYAERLDMPHIKDLVISMGGEIEVRCSSSFDGLEFILRIPAQIALSTIEPPRNYT